MSISAKDLTPAERLRVARLRRGENQVEAASRLGLTPASYKRLEAGGPGDPWAGTPRIGRLTPGEQCMLLRLRSGFTQADVAKAAGVCRYTMHRAERGKVAVPAVLAKYWGL